MNYQKSYKGKGESVINYDTKQYEQDLESIRKEAEVIEE